MASAATRIHTTVLPGGRIEFAAPSNMREGDEVDVLLVPVCREPVRCYLIDILDSLPKGLKNFNTAEEVDQYLRTERDSWER